MLYCVCEKHLFIEYPGPGWWAVYLWNDDVCMPNQMRWSLLRTRRSSSHWLLLAKASVSTHAQTTAGWRWGLKMLCSARWGVSPAIMPRFNRQDPKYIPAQREFLTSRIWDFVWTFTALYLITHFPLQIYNFDFSLVPDGFLHRLSDVSPREWAIRIYLTISGVGVPYLTLKAGHSLFSVIAVILGDDLKEWPPLFGSIREAYRVRSFYV